MVHFQPEGFNKKLDQKLLTEWKEAAKAHQSTAMVTVFLFVAAFVSVIFIGGLIGLALFFGLMLASISMNLHAKRSSVGETT
jgi:hypothetical protein